MRKIYQIVLVGLLASCGSSKITNMNTANVLTDQERREGWQSLFDGATTTGWHMYNKGGVGKAWRIMDSALYFDPSVKRNAPNEGGDLTTNEEFENFHLKLDWKISPGGNSGIMFYVVEDAKFEHPYLTGPEMQVLDNNAHPDAKIIKHRAGDLYDLISAKETVRPVGEWNQAEIISNGGKLQFFLNGQQVLTTTMWDDAWRNMIANSKFKTMPAFGTYRKGKIALQDHGDPVWYRNIKIRRL